MANHMRADLVVDALQMALARRRPRPGLIHHSDQGKRSASFRDGGLAAGGSRRALNARQVAQRDIWRG
jgi:putative transposase